jgi:formylglycine-generating enzyme required for sulfatase activity
MIWLRTEMKSLRIILALACSFTTSTHAVAQAKAAPRAARTVFRDCRACPEMVVLPAGSFTMDSSAEEKIMGGKPWQ